MPRFKKSDIEFHSNGLRGTRRPAINVKNYTLPSIEQIQARFDCSEDVAEKALSYAVDSARERFWEEMGGIVQDIWGSRTRVWSEGRSGGWLVVADGPDSDVSSWDAVAVSQWGRLVKACLTEIKWLSSWENIAEDIDSNQWAVEGAEVYNFVDTAEGIKTVPEMKRINAAALPMLQALRGMVAVFNVKDVDALQALVAIEQAKAALALAEDQKE